MNFFPSYLFCSVYLFFTVLHLLLSTLNISTRKREKTEGKKKRSREGRQRGKKERKVSVTLERQLGTDNSQWRRKGLNT